MIDWLYLVKKELKLSIKTMRLDNSGDNMAFHKLIQFKPDFHIKFEFTAPTKLAKWNMLLRPYFARQGPC
jgi:hypothetical protein